MGGRPAGAARQGPAAPAHRRHRAGARRVATDTWLESPDDDLADHVSRAIDLLAAGLTEP